MATRQELEAIKRRLQKKAEEEAAQTPDWKALAKKSNKGLKKSRAGSKRFKEDLLNRGGRMPGSGWSKTG